jgi:uncharacterized protein
MSKELERLPVQIDPFRLAMAGREYKGSIPLSHFKRLGPLLSDNKGQVTVELKFGIDKLGIELQFGQGQIKTDLMIYCQRCLEGMKLQVDIEFINAFVKTAKEAEVVPDPYEAFLVESLPIMLLDLIEDEILLSLPGIPLHTLDNCPARHWINASESEQAIEGEKLIHGKHSVKSEHPFSMLAQLKTPNKGK